MHTSLLTDQFIFHLSAYKRFTNAYVAAPWCFIRSRLQTAHAILLDRLHSGWRRGILYSWLTSFNGCSAVSYTLRTPARKIKPITRHETRRCAQTSRCAPLPHRFHTLAARRTYKHPIYKHALARATSSFALVHLDGIFPLNIPFVPRSRCVPVGLRVAPVACSNHSKA